MTDPPPIRLDLRLTGTTTTDAEATGDATTDLPRQRLTPAAETREQVGQLGERDLRLAVPGAGVLGEDVEDQAGAVDHLDLEGVLESAQPAGESSPSQMTVSAAER